MKTVMTLIALIALIALSSGFAFALDPLFPETRVTDLTGPIDAQLERIKRARETSNQAADLASIRLEEELAAAQDKLAVEKARLLLLSEQIGAQLHETNLVMSEAQLRAQKLLDSHQSVQAQLKETDRILASYTARSEKSGGSWGVAAGSSSTNSEASWEAKTPSDFLWATDPTESGSGGASSSSLPQSPSVLGKPGASSGESSPSAALSQQPGQSGEDAVSASPCGP